MAIKETAGRHFGNARVCGVVYVIKKEEDNNIRRGRGGGEKKKEKKRRYNYSTAVS